jgi:hypothetical protein
MANEPLFTEADRQQMKALDIAEDEARRQVALFANPPAQTRLLRPCSVGDGITQLAPARHAALLEAWSDAARAGRLTKFVPASGAASRMFQSLLAAKGANDDAAADVRKLFEALPRFAFKDALAAVLERRGTTLSAELASGKAGRVLAALFDDDGLGYSSLPKGLIPFHRYDGGPRTAFDEHLVEGAACVRDAAGVARLHFTVAEEFRGRFTEQLSSVRSALEAAHGVRFQVGFSEQAHATDTLAVDGDNRPFRAPDGTLVFRPGGHGSLLHNLEALGGDVVFVKNIDNVQHERHAAATTLWKKLLAGHLLLLEQQARALDARLEKGEGAAAEAEARAFLRDGLGLGPDASLTCLRRPLRVCGVVKNQGEPGGGPFWVRGDERFGAPQIVESSQVDLSDAAQAALWKGSSHFNPVDLVVSLRRADGSPHPLKDFVDPSTVFISKKSKDGRELKALERPGLWNGAMAGWNTVFVEVPPETFTPVKTVFDLLRPLHQPE